MKGRVSPAAFDEPVYVTRPLFPDLRAYTSALEGIWQRRWLTNKGEVHDALEQALCDTLRVRHLSLVTNGTMALVLAYRAFGLSGEVVTTPFTSLRNAVPGRAAAGDRRASRSARDL